MALMESIVSSSQVALNQACEAGGVCRMLVEAVEEGSAACQEHAAGILLLICKSCRERYRGMILKRRAMGLLQLTVGLACSRDNAKALLCCSEIATMVDHRGPSAPRTWRWKRLCER
ncbi:UNVERIFIED_CONTAM: hypothetical protein Sangu_0239600 [Sesamum angustifolium]|uniref:Uncharacterized protein n=1 Tax=Sesamum angustifolium TaxID=2727405 RepID=A0AAW2RQP8_9LAMI